MPPSTPSHSETGATTPGDGTVGVSDEMFAALPSGLEICYQTFGDRGAEPLLLVMGLGGPMTWWDTDLCTLLASRGFYVVRYDNRDTGRSSRVPERVRQSTLVRAFLGRRVQTPYRLSDLAQDAFDLLDHLELESAHVAGVSMGGMIAQTMALGHPERVRSLTSIMSSTGRRTAGWQSPALLPTLIAPRGPNRDDYIAAAHRTWRLIGSPAYPQTDEELTRRAGETFDRGVSRSGVMRQMIAVLTQRDRTLALRSLDVPTVVVHGLADKMVHVSGGRATAAAIPGAELVLVDGMGHDMPKALFDTFAGAIARAAARAADRPS